MAETTTQESESNRSKSTEKTKEKKEKSKPLTKVVIRRLPPTMSEETFLEQISPIPDHDYFYFVNADRTLGVHSFCRAYINFANSIDIFNFKEKFDNYVFVDNRGNEFPAVVEYAPYQGVPKKKSRKNDPKCGTIETDPHYLEFLESLKVDENEANKQDKTEFTYQFKDDKKKTTTPLLEYIAARKLEKQRIKTERKEERRKRELERKKMREEDRRRRKIEFSKAKQNIIDEETYAEDNNIKELDAETVKPNTKEVEDSAKAVSKYKGKSYKEKYAEDYPRKPSVDDRKIDIKPKIRDDRRYNDGDHLRKSEYRSTYTRSKIKDDERKFDAHRGDSKESKREVRPAEILKPEKKFEVKKYSEARKEREARRNELKKIAKKDNEIDNDKTESVKDSKTDKIDDTDGDQSKNNKLSDPVEDRLEENDASDAMVKDVENLAESLQETITLKDNTAKTDSVDSTCEANSEEPLKKSNSKGINKENDQEETDSTKPSEEQSHDKVENYDSEARENDDVKPKDTKKSEKRSQEDRRDPRTERRIRNKDRPSMAIYQPGKARLNKEKSSTSLSDEAKMSN